MKKTYKDTEKEADELYSKIISKTELEKFKPAVDRLIKKAEEERLPGMIRSLLDNKGLDGRSKPIGP